MWNFGPKRHSRRVLYFKSNTRVSLPPPREGGRERERAIGRVFEARDAFRIRVFAVPNFHRRSRSTVDGTTAILAIRFSRCRTALRVVWSHFRNDGPYALVSWVIIHREKRVIVGRRCCRKLQRVEYFSSRDAQLWYYINTVCSRVQCNSVCRKKYDIN